MDLSYGYANARIKAMESQLLKQEQFREISVVGTLPEVIALLQETGYKNDLVEASKKYADIRIILNGLQTNFSSTLKKLSRVMPPKADKLFEIAAAELYVQDVKTVVSKKLLGQEVTEAELNMASEKTQKTVRKLIAASTPEDVLEALRGTDCAQAVSRLEKEGNAKDLRKLLDAIDACFYERLCKLSKDPSLEKNTRAFLSDRLQRINALMVLRLKQHASNDEIRERLLPAPSPLVEKLIEAKDMDEAVLLLGLPEQVMQQYAKSRALSTIELGLERKFMQGILKKFKASVLSFGVVLGFIYLKQAEVDTIKRIALGKYFGIEEEMKQHIYLVT
ncbi:V-type ATPase subunit [Candidatus Micrarchaeota archaeon]|nr:V-type ATPase subunit [Candidatus Micrarchaeota archaeon]